ncbi:GNAT family N-acetyltransferase [Paenibacillus planticolens]|uniref:GNAT family N-acetyltransferase n=1 Tax=Paenibacillus planticolens TaxID=2654976 RepID=A0ABX1ZSJ6_9BACL|nr:GNAT family N-acetyltransferase [Paenibacillus planticolens]NOV01912.1 GNAT family N-acetyltransferase [Paenibacillus planticolens]
MKLNHPESGQLLVLLNHDYVIGMVNMLFTISTAEGGKAIILEDYILSESERGEGYGSFFMQKIINFVELKALCVYRY